MILNGKCKEKFLEWFSEPETYFYRLNNTCQNALIIEFFDSIEIIIQIHNVCDDWWFRVKSKTKTIKSEKYNEHKNRKEATEQAIKKANDIYNERNKNHQYIKI